MKLAISNIAWPTDQDAAVADLLNAVGVRGVEVAPTKIWPAPLEAGDAAVDAYRQFWEARGIRLVAAQSLLFGRPDLTLFDSAEIRARTLEYLDRIVRLCARLGAEALVFGSPKNRRVGAAGPDEFWPVAVDFFGRLGEVAAREGTTVVLEANPPAYGADFITRAIEAVELVRAVNGPGLRLHLDTACMALAGDDVAAVFDAGFDLLHHFHISEPQLAAIGGGGVDHAASAGQLLRRGYDRWVSIEMRQADPFTLDGLTAALRSARESYSL